MGAGTRQSTVAAGSHVLSPHCAPSCARHTTCIITASDVLQQLQTAHKSQVLNLLKFFKLYDIILVTRKMPWWGNIYTMETGPCYKPEILFFREPVCQHPANDIIWSSQQPYKVNIIIISIFKKRKELQVGKLRQGGILGK